MKQKPLWVIIYSLFLITTNLVLVENIFACQCPPQAICQVYSRSKAVFVGKVVKIEDDESEASPHVRVTFSVEKAFKGKLEKIENARFLNTTCQTQFKAGERYFVYEEDPADGCNPSEPLAQAKAHLEYAESLSESSPIFNISGLFNELSLFDAERMKVTIENGEKRYKPDISEYGTFYFTTKEKGTYKIKILFNYPLQLSLSRSGIILPDKARYSITSSQTFLEYDAEFEPNGCDSREFYVFPQN